MNNPIATYRLQFHKDFTFTDAARIIPYLEKLGVKTVYASPIFEAVPGSVHGYDSVNPHRVNPEIGTEAQLKAIRHALATRNIGWLQDIVPNHMAFDPANKWLMDVLEKGQLSLYESFFDINWTSPIHDGRVMAPFLGSSLADVIRQHELTVAYQAPQLVLAYYETAYPLHLRSYATVLQAGDRKPDEPMRSLLEQLRQLLQTDEPKAYALQVTAFQTALAALLDTEPGKAYLATCLTAINTHPERLQQIAGEQVYEWCAHAETDQRINYRRFFTVNSLICLNMQEPVVFDHFHERIKNLIGDGVFQGLRIDHIDGLYDPAGYLNRLRTLAGEDAYLVVEKILQNDEALPPDWPVQGATGYSYLSMVNNLFTQTKSGPAFTRFYHQLLGEKMVVGTELRDKKRYILRQHMGGELDNLYHIFLNLCLASEDALATIPPETLKSTIGEFLIQCPVYRYYGNQLPLAAEEHEAVRLIFDNIRRTKPGLSAGADLLEAVLLEKPRAGNEAYNHRALRFYQRCMQFTGPLMAKGVEDTLMYTYNRFIGHDEVGDSPVFFGLTIDQFHRRMMDRQVHWPLALNATSTHDTKRGEDVRSRLNVLTDLTDEWIEEVEVWQKLNQSGKAKAVVVVPGDDTTEEGITEEAPDANDEYFIYQTLLGAYPMPGQDDDDFPNRLAEYLQKVLREAKRFSTWNHPDEAYEEATQRFAARLLDLKRSFWARFQAFHRQISDFGIVNSLAQVVLKCTCPGLPDVYQGCEFWDLSLVDPDNRRPVDFDKRQQALTDLIDYDGDTETLWRSLWENRYDARIKQGLIHVLLTERSQNADLFATGAYLPLPVEGEYRQHIVAFARHLEQQWYVIAIPVGLAQLCRAQQVDIASADWSDTRIILPADAPKTWEHRLLKTTGTASAGIRIGDVFATIPLAVLVVN